jgi:crooked neck
VIISYCTGTDWELIFADDEREANPTSFKFLQMAHAWKNSEARKTGNSGLLSGFTAATAAKEDTVPVTNVSTGTDTHPTDDATGDVSGSDSG